ncbi:MAG: ribosome biogenesis GTP-binding protein YihA/YsxC [Bacteroidota bacterium]
MKIKEANFVKSSSKYSDCPPENIPEYAFIGRSNVGKSSLINMITGRKDLAKTSSKPGKTQLINHFLINDHWYLVDLPGYGWAKVGKDKRATFGAMIQDYILNRRNLLNLFVLIDSRIDAQPIDLEFIQWLGVEEIPFSLAFTKSDKVGNSKIKNQIQKYLNNLKSTWDELPPAFITSATTKKGGADILSYIDEINKFAKDKK